MLGKLKEIFFANDYHARIAEGPYGRAKSWPIAESTVKYKFRNKLREPLPRPIM